MATQPQVTAGGSRQRVLVAALAGVLLLLVGLLVVRPLLGGSDEGQATPPAVTAGASPTTTTPQLIGPSTSVTPSDAAAGSVKDPFKPLVSAGAAAAVTDSGVTAGSAPGSVTSSTVATGSTVAGAGAGTAITPGGGTSTERQVALVSIKGGTAKVTVDGTAYSVTEGESFAGSYRAVDINSECASFESGTTSFTLCEGEAVLK
jgi:hypothetical protein